MLLSGGVKFDESGFIVLISRLKRRLWDIRPSHCAHLAVRSRSESMSKSSDDDELCGSGPGIRPPTNTVWGVQTWNSATSIFQG